jgi:HEAT repeat protein
MVREPQATTPLLFLLDDRHEEVRAAAVEALGRIADPAALPRLVSLLRPDSHHQTARIVSAIRGYGPPAAVELSRQALEGGLEKQPVADVLGQIGSSVGLDLLAAWTDDPDPTVRAACWKAIGSIGLDDRGYYFALRALGDDDAEVRAMAARALGRGGRAEAAGYLAPRLSDEWRVAAQTAAALKQLGASGRAVLEVESRGSGMSGALARQMLWEARG